MGIKKEKTFAQSKSYQVWRGIMRRCRTVTDPCYKYYGGRGITVCGRWLRFENFLADMGERPEGMSIDRIDNNGNYEPSNCRWATKHQQMQNTRKTVRIERDGVWKTSKEWEKITGIPAIVLQKRRLAKKTEKEIFAPIRIAAI